MREARDAISSPLVANQGEHPLLDQSRLMAAALETRIPLSSYCPVARGEVFRYPLFGEIGLAYGKTPAQVVLRWILQRWVSLNTMSSHQEHIAANFDIMDFTLSHIGMAAIDQMQAIGHRVVDHNLVPWAPDWD